MVKRKKSRRVKQSKKSSNNILLLTGIVVILAVVALSQINTGSITNVKEIKDSNVSDIKKTKEASKPLNIPKKEKAINKKRINERELMIRFAELDWNSNKKVSKSEYLYYFKDKSQGKKIFKIIDKDKSGSISYKEYKAYRTK